MPNTRIELRERHTVFWRGRVDGGEWENHIDEWLVPLMEEEVFELLGGYTYDDVEILPGKLDA